MDGGTFPDGHLEVLGRLSERQRRMLEVMGGLDLYEPLAERTGTWLRVAEEVVRAEPSVFGEDEIGELLVRYDAEESLPAFVLRELRFSSEEREQIEALLPVARTQWYLLNGRSAAPEQDPAPGPGKRPRRSGTVRPPAEAQRRYTDITRWEGDIWTAVDSRRGRRVYLRAADAPGQDGRWSERPPRFQSLERYGTGHWRGYDMAAGRWMYLAHPGAGAPDERHAGWTEEPPAVLGVEVDEEEYAPEFDEAVQSLVNAVRWEDMRLEDLASPLGNLAVWARMPSLGPLAERAGALDRELAAVTDPTSRNLACRAVADLHAEMERIGTRFDVMDGWPAGWAADRGAGPQRYARMLRLGCQDLRGAARRIARTPEGADAREAAGRRTSGRSEGEVTQAIGGLLNFAWAMGRDNCPGEWFADPLHTAARLSALSALNEGCPDLALGARYVDEAVRQFYGGAMAGGAYEGVLGEFQKLLRRYSERLLGLRDRWPAWEGGRDELPQESPTAFAVMMRLGWQMLEAERQELRTFVGWETGLRSPNMPKPRSPGSSRLSGARARIPKRTRPLTPLALPDVAQLRVLAHAIAGRDWPADALEHPLSWVDHWRASAGLADGYPEFRERAAGVARIYGQRQSYGESYKDAVAGLVGVLESIRVGLGMLGPGWPAAWADGGHKVPEQSPAVLVHLIEEGKRELRRSARDLTLDLRAKSTAPRAWRSATPQAAASGRGRHAPPPTKRWTRRRPSSTAESVRRFFLGSAR
ncbi:hypothetical protein ACFQ78_39115 [Streptomyces sp. NPDC056519]|uniref:hypothetical protein n=1 Tax=Streptomyces sp. NPDC056519 TaxID=3345849 RepID=UPI0036B6DDBD